ncbi:MAG TPA: N-acetylmuramoyl-L-alanine amidase [Chloroflexia bacterium]|nr:N-acetylmuramoyl-L-alanine amidase [Chloroflexia bacterium]
MKERKTDSQPAMSGSAAPDKSIAHGYGGTLLKAGRSRRQFLKLAGGVAVIAGAGLVIQPWGSSNLLGAPSDWVIQTGFPASGTFTSPVQPVTTSFTAIGSYWEVKSGDGNQLSLQLRVSDDGVKFSDWIDAHPDSDEGRVKTNLTRFYGRVQFLSGKYAQFRMNIPSGISVKLVGLTFIDGSAGGVPPQTPPRALIPSGKPNKPYIISRADWGANESYRFSGGAQVWPPEYRTAKAIIVHHSETPNSYNANPAVDVRGIYYYHAITKGWGDIGYNFLIDWKGNIYEGRYGGDDVVGGHAYQYNYGSVGICMIGSFSSVTPPKAMQDALVSLVAWKCAQRNINPTSKVFLIDKTVNAILGHRDVIDTTCPGNSGYAILPSIRTQVAGVIQQPSSGSYNVDLKSVTFSPTTLKAGDVLRVDAVISNTGTLPLESQDPAPGYTYNEGQTFESLNLAKQDGKFRFAVDFTGNSGVSHPYRWGLGKTLQPGETVTVTGYIKMQTQRQVDMFGSVVQEYVKYWEDNVGTTRVTTGSGSQTGGGSSGSNPTDRAPSRASDPNVRYFNETGHNLGYGFRGYWERNGGLELFGYPLTEEFTEESPTQPGKFYTVQYFQRNRFEYHPEYKGTQYEVLLGLLGVQLTADRTFFKTAAFTNTASKVYFKETGHSLGGTFYSYWKAHGGLPIFGYPISEEFQERNADDGKVYTVQYFERNRFEYHPENKGTRYEVLLGLLGTEICRRKGWLK